MTDLLVATRILDLQLFSIIAAAPELYLVDLARDAKRRILTCFESKRSH